MMVVVVTSFSRGSSHQEATWRGTPHPCLPRRHPFPKESRSTQESGLPNAHRRQPSTIIYDGGQKKSAIYCEESHKHRVGFLCLRGPSSSHSSPRVCLPLCAWGPTSSPPQKKAWSSAAAAAAAAAAAGLSLSLSAGQKKAKAQRSVGKVPGGNQLPRTTRHQNPGHS